MIDTVQVVVISGNGGNGAISGRREKFVPHGGPDGGDGGNGGSVHIRGDAHLRTLLSLHNRGRLAAGGGGAGGPRLRHGRNGLDIEINVPVGTEVRKEGRTQRLVGDVVEAGQRLLVASGGKGGRGNARFATSTNRFPLLAEEGESGESLMLRLELKLLADVGVVGAPNAGKSSLLAAISRARPKIAEYPFTTLSPALGVVEYQRESFVAVDIPGLIEGAHAGAGLGDEFLRHIQRTRVLVHMVDGSADDPISDYLGILEEMRLFDNGLAAKPRIVAINKVDLGSVRSSADRLKQEFEANGATPRFISAVTREGLDELLGDVLQQLAQESDILAGARREADDDDSVPVLRPRPRQERLKVRSGPRGYVVESSAAARIAAMVNQEDWNAIAQFYGEMKRMGVVRALEAAGVAPGDTVRIGKVEWEWE